MDKERKVKIKPVNEDNGISIGKADNDGIHIIENTTGTGVYIYFNEINETTQKMRTLLYEYNNNGSGNRAQANKNYTEGNAGEYKSLSKLKSFYGSSDWRVLRERRLKMDGGRCVNCGSESNLEVHHVCYDRVFDGCVDDLRTLCCFCHGDVTRLIRGKRRGVFYG